MGSPRCRREALITDGGRATSGALLGESLVWWDIDFTEGEKGEDWLRELFGLFGSI